MALPPWSACNVYLSLLWLLKHSHSSGDLTVSVSCGGTAFRFRPPPELPVTVWGWGKILQIKSRFLCNI